MIRKIFFILFIFISLNAFAQRGKETIVNENGKRKLSKTEINFMTDALDSIQKNLNRMIIFEKELKQRNYYLSEKTKLIDALVSIIQSLQQSINVVDISVSNLKKIFGKPSIKSKTNFIYQIETYKSNCPFIEITFTIHENSVSKIQYRITDCEKK